MASNKSKTPGPIQVVVVLMLTVLAFYFGNRFGQVFDFNTMEITDGALATVNSIVAAPAAISMASVRGLTDRGRFWSEHPAPPDLFVMASAEIDSFRHFNDAKSL